ncbi:hypothetical protein PRIPAC_82240 [Pristionchus pacificus]|uniref:Elongation of very long chain fatty acids protein n=1 Tax=Pristionchus pacificus TaxID=54126 RepID=A0A2A6C1W3_PRIPA|nr:hypothetical protein PRIPAC_82240 [Pristionchus pacificus]|eukprot:PDM72097.1 hypothetical protein PRIPAC_38531 [Pristionchus pacificus]
MLTMERLQTIKFNSTELVDLLTEENFNYRRAGDWMDEHTIFAFQMVGIYMVLIFALKHWMRYREPFNLKMPLAVSYLNGPLIAWNAFIASLSLASVLAMSWEYWTTLFERGPNDTLCFTQEEYFGGKYIGKAVFVLIFARLPELIDTIFIVLRKQPLIFLHWYHHTVTLTVAWYTYSSRFSGSVHLVLVNALIHTVMYSYYFLTAVGIKPHPLVAQSITIGQITQFIYAMYGLVYITVFHYGLGEPCNIVTGPFVIHWIMVTSYTYLFVDFYLNKYQGVKAARKVEKEVLAQKKVE